MLIKKVDGSEVSIDDIWCAGGTNEIWVKWLDIKPILQEYQEAIENETVGISDWSMLDRNE